MRRSGTGWLRSDSHEGNAGRLDLIQHQRRRQHLPSNGYTLRKATILPLVNSSDSTRLAGPANDVGRR